MVYLRVGKPGLRMQQEVAWQWHVVVPNKASDFGKEFLPMIGVVGAPP
jgi:hypothetical protein